jgi:L-threonylcarbamoyladenylate synthase
VSEILWLEDDKGVMLRAAELLRNGGVVVFPTDSVYGLLAWPWEYAGYKRIYELKGRDFTKPLALLVSSSIVSKILGSETDYFISTGGGDIDLALAFQAGETTLILSPEWDWYRDFPQAISKVQPGKVGLRCPNKLSLQNVIERCGGYLWATSVNRSGQPPATSADEVLSWLDELKAAGIDPPELVVLSRTPGSGKPSRVVDLTGDEPQWIR